MQTLRRELRTKFEGILKHLPETEALAELLADAALEVRAFQFEGPLTPKETAEVNLKVDAIIEQSQSVLTIRQAMKSWPFNVRWDSKNKWERQKIDFFMEWVENEKVAPQQLVKAARTWATDKRFNFKQPTLLLIYENWPALNAEPSHLSETRNREDEEQEFVAAPERK